MTDTDPIRVLVVEDSLTIRKHIVETISNADGFEVVGEASNGQEAIELCESLRPDVVSMDIMLPVMTGVAATEYIMAYCPTPILIVSASTNRGELFKTYDALSAGAVDVLEKPLGQRPDDVWRKQLLRNLRVVSRVRVITHPRAKLARGNRPQRPRKPRSTVRASSDTPLGGRVPRLVAIGASTGGPGAVLALLRGLPADFPLPVLLVIHIAEPFGRALADWFDVQSLFDVRYPVDGEPLEELRPRTIVMARPDVHLEVRDGVLRETEGPERHGCRPSVDVLFESLADEVGASVVGCLLTGMGKDGAAGLLDLYEAGAETVVQDRETSVIFGMPGTAVELGAARHVLPLQEIPDFLTRLLRRHRSASAADARSRDE